MINLFGCKVKKILLLVQYLKIGVLWQRVSYGVIYLDDQDVEKKDRCPHADTANHGTVDIAKRIKTTSNDAIY